ncbi:secreted protein [Candidatus Magnetoovum chiemensis]|nr:secreted protein [Candidatus Magnetoovum chiemensis]
MSLNFLKWSISIIISDKGFWVVLDNSISSSIFASSAFLLSSFVSISVVASSFIWTI